jgi:hypothetical protein
MTKPQKPAASLDHFNDFFIFLGVPSNKLEEIPPKNEDAAANMGATILDQDWFNIEEMDRGSIFGITDALRDLRREKDSGHPNARRWAWVCAMIEALPESEDPDDIYTHLAFNMKAIKDGTEVAGDDGLKVGYRVWPESR